MIGGLGIKTIRYFILPLLCEWLWRLDNEEESLWATIIRRRFYDRTRVWGLSMHSHHHTSHSWKGILKSLNIIRAGTRVKLGNGQQCLFQEDRWCTDRLFKDNFPQLFAISLEPLVLVVQQFEAQTGGGSLTPTFEGT